MVLIPFLLARGSIFFFFFFTFSCAGSLSLLGLFSSCGEQGLLSSCSAPASRCVGFSCGGAQALGPSGSVAVAPRP